MQLKLHVISSKLGTNLIIKIVYIQKLILSENLEVNNLISKLSISIPVVFL